MAIAQEAFDGGETHGIDWIRTADNIAYVFTNLGYNSVPIRFIKTVFLTVLYCNE